MSRHKLSFVLVLASLLAAQTVEADGPGGVARSFKSAPIFLYISEGRRTAAPFAHVMFCARHPDECSVRGKASQILLSPFADKQLHAVNASVNGSIRPVDEQSDQGDVWQENVESGDCEDYALTKRDHLIALGWPSKALRIAVTKTSSGKGHAVLVVRTDRGDLVLDNRTNEIRDWKDADLRWLMIQSGEDPRVWFEL
ncbi:putative transglutaminase-like cysteine proteinase [Rhizobium sp. BK529]|uniref:transglutaminase-like cysteine peptidase n=1 Tax=unclassified Rhizobium TaxID=2613769 RepID=UPI00104CA145|nr:MULTISPECIES: transglutaminase-like cysteine peptidase [unclassified Rhizobium]MBB3593330.1 putative transglutaminase-like cysteine proteinase [Rhizobium sp. BK529]TCS03128.1 putative transglutaminase-like cysteine proteinase [Rhizobium sp. BK418]